MAQSLNEKYMDARIEMDSAIESFILASYRADFSLDSIARSILDSIYDADIQMYRSVVCSMQPR